MKRQRFKARGPTPQSQVTFNRLTRLSPILWVPLAYWCFSLLNQSRGWVVLLTLACLGALVLTVRRWWRPFVEIEASGLHTGELGTVAWENISDVAIDDQDRTMLVFRYNAIPWCLTFQNADAAQSAMSGFLFYIRRGSGSLEDIPQGLTARREATPDPRLRAAATLKRPE